MCLIFLSLLLVLAFIILCVMFVTWYQRADGDLSLLYAERYGVKLTDAFAGRVIWIIGCASGIGEELAYALAECGGSLVLSDRNADELKRVQQKCLEIGSVQTDDLLYLPLDVTDFNKHKKVFDDVIKHFGKIDIVFHNAGCSQSANFHDVTTEVDRELFDINCFGHVSLARIIAKHFLSRGGGQFVVTSSALGLFGFPHGSTYVGTKFAIRGFFEAIRAEYITQGIYVTIIFPGAIFSNIFNSVFTTTSGKFTDLEMKPTDHRMKTSRCAKLIAVAAANHLEEAFIAMKPFLPLMYLAQYAPVFFKRFITKKYFSPEKADDLRAGRLF